VARDGRPFSFADFFKKTKHLASFKGIKDKEDEVREGTEKLLKK